ncbi:MAG: glycosyltransferase family 4 protein [Acidimicrobiales bacterium]|nr:glycosyltransferase family 4 protein [Acidimicrobiales bacterium]MCB9373349.1 glycosyltransferase family 4 protein [Microthrixaceae bacterium]
MSAPSDDGRGTPDVVFVSHEATRTGAPLMLLYVLRWLRDHSELRFEVLLLEGGAIEADFAAVAPTTVVADIGPGRLDGVARRFGAHRLADRLHERRRRAALAPLRGASLVYCNVLESLAALPLLDPGPPDRVVVTHIHEMRAAFRALAPAARAQLRRSDRFVAASDLVRELAIDHFGIDPERIVRHYECIDVEALHATPPPAEAVEAARRSCGIPVGAPVVGAVGVTGWRKGPDLFVLLADHLHRREATRDVHFVWLGADPEAPETRSLRRDVERAGLADVVHFVAPEPAPGRWFALFDVFTLTSREDPFPLVCLESSLLGTPIVCFANTGMAEFAGEGECGFMVDYLDVEAMAARVTDLLEDPDRRAEVGRRASERVQREFDYRVAAPLLAADIERWRPRR